MRTAKSPAIGREFLPWDRFALPEAAQRLAARYRQGSTLDLGAVIVVVPGQRAGRRLQELLALLAEDESLLFTPPRVVTEGSLPELLYTPKRPFASDLVQDLTWAQVLRDLPAPLRRNIIPVPPSDDNARRWLELGGMLRRLHRELAADGLDFAAVLKSGPKLAHFNEAQRWQALTELQRCYHLLLDAQELWDKQTARLKAIEFGEIETKCDIVLLGTVDLNDSLRQMLDQIAERVTAYVVAPDSLADHFDAKGCLVAERWRRATMPQKDDQIVQVEGPAEQADAVATWLAEVGPRFRSDEVTIGVPDESLVPQLQRQLTQVGVAARWVEDIRLGDTAPFRLLAAAVEFAGSRRYDDLAALVRHPDVESWLQPRAARQTVDAEAAKNRTLVPDAWSLPAQLDRFYNARLPSRIAAEDVAAGAKAWPNLAAALAMIETWLAPAEASRPLRQWGDCFRGLLAAIYDKRILDLDSDGDDVIGWTITTMLAAYAELGSLPAALDTAPVSAADAFAVALGPLANESLPPPADPDAVEILGWLELPLDDAPALIVTTFNEGFVPKSAGADAFLPDQLRRELGLMHNERRYARDAYATSVLCHARPELRFVLARRDTNKDPLQPSRLLFACDDAALVQRARRFFGDGPRPSQPRRLLLAGQKPLPRESSFTVPAPAEPLDVPMAIPVTHFRSYLACPYRYYLRHVRNLEAIDDSARELGGDLFGSLLHRVLSRFGGNADMRNNKKERDIADFLVDALGKDAERLYGSDQRRAAVRLQLEQARLRLLTFARHQAKLVADGWHIICAEHVVDANGEGAGQNTTTQLEVRLKDLGEFSEFKKTEVRLVGRIDRIDWHEAQNRILVIDYKTADKPQSPEKTHRQGDDWIDLQLPLYRHLLRKAVPNSTFDNIEDVAFAYFNLPHDDADAGLAPAEWTDADVEAADQAACAVIRGILARKFTPITRPAPDFSEDFAAICLDNRYDHADADEEGGEGPP